MIIVVMFTSTVIYAGHLTDELLISARLTGDQEVPMVATDAEGVASFTLNSTWDTLFVNVSANGLSGPITGIHVHEGAPGENGPVITGITDFVVGNRVITAITGEDLTMDMISKYLSGEYYLNIHTDANPGGEIRGQLELETDWGFRTDLDADQQTADVISDALGVAYFNLGKNQQELEIRMVANDLTGAILAAHLHYGMPGEDGPVVVDLTSFINGNSIAANVDANMPNDLVDNMLAGNVYLNVHTAEYPAGEIRGQLWLDERLTFDAWLNTDQEVMPPTGSDGYGSAYLSLNTTLDTLWYEIQASELSGPITGAHLHTGAPGVDGDVLIPLTADVDGMRISGMITGIDITDELVSKMLTGEIYVNIHTTLNPAGEIRGQVYRLAREGYAFALESNQEIPYVFSVAKGGGIVSIDRDQTNAHFMIVVSDLSGPLQGAHFHNAPTGNNGPVIFNLPPFFDGMGTDDAAFGYWTESDGNPFTTTSSEAFRNEMVYVNIHTELHPAGEVRGQVLRGAQPFAHQMADNGMLPDDPNFTNGLLFTAKATGDQIVPPVDTEALGVGGFLLNATRDTIWVNINIDGLSGPITAMHIHEGEVGTNGDVVIGLTDMLTGYQARGFITDFDLAEFIDGSYYLNIHTDANPAGEIRGQIMFETDWTFIADINGENEVPVVETDAFGKGVVNLSQDETSLQVRIVSTGLSGPITGAHFHVGPVDENGPVIENLTPFITENSIVVDTDPSGYIDELKAGNLYINIHTEANPDGEIRGQLMLAEAFVFDAWMNGAQEVPETEVSGRGVGALWLNNTWDTLSYDIVVDQISAPIAGFHIHGAALGENGGVLIGLTDDVMGNRISGQIGGSALTDEIITAMIMGDTYLNLHTEDFPAGEIRGQIYRLAHDGFSYMVCGDQEVPSIDVDGYGGGILSINRDQDNAHVMFTATMLTGPITGAHLHDGDLGENGPVIYGLTDEIVENSAFAYVEISEADAELIKNGGFYLNIHTDEYPSGELRGQIDNSVECPSITTSVDDLNAEAGFEAYPIPFRDQLNIAYDLKAGEQYNLRVMNMVGKTVRSVALTGESGIATIDMSEISAGLYLVEITSESVRISRKVIK